jgi:pyridinium-3,5-biscarboxylic acid mononucleotide sulfurtransferase
VGKAERHLRAFGLRNLRVRSEGDTARIELPAEQIKEFVLTTDLPTLTATFQSYGFLYITLDLEGFRSGKLNQVLQVAAPV